ncbi:MAG: hypothetical protein JXR07_17965 [Reichenbachiella sp.]
MKLAVRLIIYSIFFVALNLQAQQPEEKKKPKTTLTIGGFAKLDFMTTVFEGGEPADPESPIRDIHIAGAIPIGGEQSFDTHMHIKESRFNLALNSELLGKPVMAFFEMDMLLSAAGDARVSNSYNPRIRHFYFNYGDWLFGQTWSTFMIVIIPDDLDFSGAAEGIVFNRQPQVRYTAGKWQFSLEVPESTITPNGGGAFISSSGGIPDAVVRRNFKGDWGNAGLSVIARNPRYYDVNGDRHGVFGYGVTGGALIKVGAKDDVRLQATYGNGLGRYLALAYLNSSVINNEGELETISSVNGFISYLHYWSDKWRSSVNYSVLEAFNPEFTGEAANQKAWSASANIICAPVPQLLFGLEGMYGYRGLESGEGDGFYRLQFSAKYTFKYQSK